ncbi:hypothetical protein C0991_001943 [Blastosporella zonata]|nr:hypothetical protein C0991_001943 [Blastosporella zonata]
MVDDSAVVLQAPPAFTDDAPSDLISIYNSDIPSPVPSVPSPPKDDEDDMSYSWDAQKRKDQEYLDEAILQSLLEASAADALGESIPEETQEQQTEIPMVEADKDAEIQAPTPAPASPAMINDSTMDADVVTAEVEQPSTSDFPLTIFPPPLPFSYSKDEGEDATNTISSALTPLALTPFLSPPISAWKEEEEESSPVCAQDPTDSWDLDWRKEQDEQGSMEEAILQSMLEASVNLDATPDLNEDADLPSPVPDMEAPGEAEEATQDVMEEEEEEDNVNVQAEEEAEEEGEGKENEKPDSPPNPAFCDLDDTAQEQRELEDALLQTATHVDEQEKRDLEEAMFQSQLSTTYDDVSAPTYGGDTAYADEQEKSDLDQAIFQPQLSMTYNDVSIPSVDGGDVEVRDECEVQDVEGAVEGSGRPEVEGRSDKEGGGKGKGKDKQGSLSRATPDLCEEDELMIEEFTPAKLIQPPPPNDRPLKVQVRIEEDTTLADLALQLVPGASLPVPTPFSSIPSSTPSPIVRAQSKSRTQPASHAFVAGRLTQRFFAQSCLPPQPKSPHMTALDVDLGMDAAAALLEERDEEDTAVLSLAPEPSTAAVDVESPGVGDEVDLKMGVVLPVEDEMCMEVAMDAETKTEVVVQVEAGVEVEGQVRDGDGDLQQEPVPAAEARMEAEVEGEIGVEAGMEADVKVEDQVRNEGVGVEVGMEAEMCMDTSIEEDVKVDVQIRDEDEGGGVQKPVPVAELDVVALPETKLQLQPQIASSETNIEEPTSRAITPTPLVPDKVGTVLSCAGSRVSVPPRDVDAEMDLVPGDETEQLREVEPVSFEVVAAHAGMIDNGGVIMGATTIEELERDPALPHVLQESRVFAGFWKSKTPNPEDSPPTATPERLTARVEIEPHHIQKCSSPASVDASPSRPKPSMPTSTSVLVENVPPPETEFAAPSIPHTPSPPPLDPRHRITPNTASESSQAILDDSPPITPPVGTTTFDLYHTGSMSANDIDEKLTPRPEPVVEDDDDLLLSFTLGYPEVDIVG